MRISIDNLDGLGLVDYTGAVAVEAPVTVQRGLNVPSRCTAEIVVGLAGLVLPVRRARVVVTADDASVVFTGYVATEPVRVYLGEGSEGAVYRARLTAVSDEWLLDKAGSGVGLESGVGLALDAGLVVERLVERLAAGGGAPAFVPGATTAALGVYAPNRSAAWSANAGAAAGAAYAGYRALGGQVMVQPAGAVTHALSDADGTLSVAELKAGAVRELANDVTVSGAEEPAEFVTECFAGDGTTQVFELSGAAFRDAHRTVLLDPFAGEAFDLTRWTLRDPGDHLSLTGAGLTMNGGNGFDGQTTLTAADAVEMGGSVVVQLGGVLLGAACDGMLAGMYAGVTTLPNCFAGFRVRQAGAVTVLVAVVNGVEVGETFTPAAGHAYTLRLRLFCPEMHRVPQRYRAMVDGVVQTFGSASAVGAPMDFVFELVDEGASSNTPATVLYDSVAVGGTVAESVGTCVFAVVNAAQMFGSVASVSVARPGSGWIVSTLPSGVQQTRLIGVAGEGVDCVLLSGASGGARGKVTFFAGRVPVAGERVCVRYRSTQRSVARLEDAASVAAEAAGGGVGTSRWLGKVLQPEARSSVDCESAVQAVLAFATSRSAAVAGTYQCVNPSSDIWPGDVLRVTSAGDTTALLVRSVEVSDGHALPELRRYKIAFANDWATEWADGLGMKLSEKIAADAVLPQTASGAPGEVLANLQQLAVVSLTETALQVDAGTAAPAGGGFEVRRRDGGWGTGGVDLVLRSPVRSFSVPRAAQVERFFVRMYDAGGVRSRFASAVLVNMPVG